MIRIVLIILVYTFVALPSFSYEVSKIQKMNQLNSYQPAQFVQADKKPSASIIDVKTLGTYRSEYLEDGNFIEVNDVNKVEPDKSAEIDEVSKDNIEEIQADNKAIELEKSVEKNIVTQEDDLEEARKILNVAIEKVNPKSGRVYKDTRWGRFMEWAKGEPADDGVMLGGFSHHVSGKRDQYNESHDLISLQYKGYTVGYFENSHHRTSLFLMWARKVWSSPEWHGFSIDFQHKTGLLSGYRGHAPNISNVSPMILPVIGLNYKKISADIWIVPNVVKPIFTLAIRVGFPDFKSRVKKAPDIPKLDIKPLDIEPEEFDLEDVAL